jgi:hypothetical protein
MADTLSPNQLVFKRNEVKYLLGPKERNALETAMEDRMTVDEHGQSMVTSIYFDTPTGLLCRRSLEGGPYKEKLRVRAYGPVMPDSSAFVEIKKKCRGIVYKRRVAVRAAGTLSALTDHRCDRLLSPDGHDAGPTDRQILSEIDFLLGRYRGIAPAFCITYLRKAFLASDGSDLRMTLDTDIRWYACTPDGGNSWGEGLASPQGSPLLGTDEGLLELKTAFAAPLWLTHLFDRLRVRPTSFSKVGRAFMADEAAHLAPAALHLATLPHMGADPDHDTHPDHLGSLRYA